VAASGVVEAGGCTWELNRACGVLVSAQGRLTARGGSAAGNLGNGVQVDETGKVTLDGFTATGNRGNGVEFCDSDGGGSPDNSVRGGEFVNNTTGVKVGGRFRVNIDQAKVSDNRGDGLVFDGQSGGAVTGDTATTKNDGYGFSLLGAVTVDCKDVKTDDNKSGRWRVAKTVPKLTRVVNCGAGRDDRPKGLFG
jgi:hypothetical protein